ncbi:hypothetical protein BH23ACT10_BH23ACT10_33260 [soil metagenome]
MVDRLWLGVTRLGVRISYLCRRPQYGRSRLRQLTNRRPGDVEVRLLLAELELAAGEIDRAIAEAGIAIQLAPDDLRGMSLLLEAQAKAEMAAR